MLTSQELQECLQFATSTLDSSRAIALRFGNEGFSSELKPDKSVVTEADRAIEEFIRDEILKHLPAHTVLGEEQGGSFEQTGFQWVIDPIDGTANFLTGIPTYGTILALFFEGQPVVAVSDHPSLNRRYHAVKGSGVFLDGQRIKVRGLSSEGELSPLENIALSARVFFEYSGEGEVFDSFVKRHPNIRIYRDVLAHGLVAQGALGAMVEMNNMIWDLAVAGLYMQEGGGVYLQTPSRGNAASEGRFNAVFGARETVRLIGPHFGFDVSKLEIEQSS